MCPRFPSCPPRHILPAADHLPRQLQNEVRIQQGQRTRRLQPRLLLRRQHDVQRADVLHLLLRTARPHQHRRAPGRPATHDSATCAIGRPISATTARSASTMAKFFSVSSMPPNGLSSLRRPSLPPPGVSPPRSGRLPAGPALASLSRPYCPSACRPRADSMPPGPGPVPAPPIGRRVRCPGRSASRNIAARWVPPTRGPGRASRSARHTRRAHWRSRNTECRRATPYPSAPATLPRAAWCGPTHASSTCR